jgi:DNA-binding beta-propeller fold protein YncE
VKAVPLPGATGPAFLDYIAYEGHDHSRVWVPVPATGSVDVLDTATGSFTRVDGFKTEARESNGKKRTRGPSAVAIGELFAYVGNRATNEICPVELKTLSRAPCLKLGTEIDGVAYVAGTHEVWVTTPEDQTMTILATTATGGLKVAGTVKVGGQPEGYAVDESRGLFFTNLEDKGGTAVIDVKKRALTATWAPGCGPDGPRGVAVDEAQHVVLVACTDHIQALDEAANGALLGKLDTGAGVDNIDFASSSRRLYVAAGKVARLTIAQVGPHGALSLVSTVDTRDGARNAVADATGNAYVADSAGASLLVVSPGAASAPAGEAHPSLGSLMVEVARRFEVAGRAAVANRFDLAEFEVGEIGEVFEDDIPHAELPKEGPTAHIQAMAKAFLATSVPDLKKAAASHERKTFDAAFERTALMCNSCHQASAKAFIEVPRIPGKPVPDLDPR